MRPGTVNEPLARGRCAKQRWPIRPPLPAVITRSPSSPRSVGRFGPLPAAVGDTGGISRGPVGGCQRQYGFVGVESRWIWDDEEGCSSEVFSLGPDLRFRAFEGGAEGSYPGHGHNAGPMFDDDGRLQRHEAVMYLARPPEDRFATLTAPSVWENGTWHLLAANWSWPTMELSVDGKPFDVVSLSATPEEGTFGGLVLGDRSGELRGLLDEVLAFRRPLVIEEVQLLWSLKQ